MKYSDIKRGLLIQGTSTSIFQKRIKNLLDLSPDLKPSYEIASPLKYTNIQKTFKNNVHEFMLPLLQTAAVYLEAPVTLKKDKKKPSGS